MSWTGVIPAGESELNIRFVTAIWHASDIAVGSD
jgi:hypothetical protein